MGDADDGPWSPLTLDQVAALFADISMRWWVTGGLALELHFQQSWRNHDDIDISLLRYGLPYLAPEIQLLFKSRNHRPKDDVDAATVIPLLDNARRSWLAEHLDAAHPWHPLIR